MNVHAKGIAMSVEDAVQEGAAIFAKAEDRARVTKAGFRKLRKIIETIRDAGHIGALECQAVAGEADALATQFEADIWAMHRRFTLRAQDLGIDLPPVTRDGGGPR